MDITLARTVFFAIVLFETTIWICAGYFLLTSSRSRRSNAEWQEPDAAEPHVDGWISGSTDVEGEAGVLAARAARLLAQGMPQQLGPVKVLDLADDRVRFERTGLANAPHQWFRRGELSFTPVATGRTAVSWLVEPTTSPWLLRLGWIFQLLGLLALIGGGWAVYTFLASAHEPALRWQTLQMLQAVHFLWPPFLFGGLYRAGGRSIRAQFETLVQNLPYCE